MGYNMGEGGDSMDEKDFSLRLAQLREKKGVSARDMSLSIGQSPGYINNIENEYYIYSLYYDFIISIHIESYPISLKVGSKFIAEANKYIKNNSDTESLTYAMEVVRKKMEDIVDKMIPVFNSIEKISIIIILGLILVATFLICNTLRITIFARRSEIEIKRLVGTSNFVIKLPFVIEGLLLGMIGAIIPIVTTIWGYVIAFNKLNGHLFTDFIKMIDPMPFSLYVSVVLLVIGGIVGFIGSSLAVRKYLKI